MTVSNELLGASALTVIGCLMVVHAHAEAARHDPRKSENNTFVESFMSDLTAGLAVWGIAASRIYTENFGAGPSKTPGIAASPRRPPHLPAGPAGAGPLVSFARSGLDVHWEPAFQSLLELAEACDIPVRWSCRTGVCHSCETGLVVGTVSYRPHPIDVPADGNVLICCCQPQGDVVIDL